MKTAKEVLEIVKDLNNRFLGKYYEGKLIVDVGLDNDGDVLFYEFMLGKIHTFVQFDFKELDSIKVSDTPPADFKYFAFSDSRRIDNIVNSLIDEGVKGERVDNSSEATSLDDLKKLLKEIL